MQGRVLLLLAALSTVVARPVHPFSVDIVTSVCREPSLAFVQDAAARFESKGFTVRRFVYCKCGERPECTAELRNVGREAHTFLTHIATNFDQLADYTFFSNGGFASKKPATGDFAETLDRMVGRLWHNRPFRFVDASWEQEPSPFRRRNGACGASYAGACGG